MYLIFIHILSPSTVLNTHSFIISFYQLTIFAYDHSDIFVSLMVDIAANPIFDKDREL
jgi:hypothetical protein